MTGRVRLELRAALPDVPDARDACVRRLRDILASRYGLDRTHVTQEGDTPVLCVHYVAGVTTVAEIERLARAAGAELAERYGHARIPLRIVAGEDAGRRVEAAAAAVPGVISASANLAAQALAVEFDRRQLMPAALDQALADVMASQQAEGETSPSWYGRNRELAWSLASGLALIGAFVTERAGVGDMLPLPLYGLAYGFGGYDLVRHAWKELRDGQASFDIDLLMLLAAIGAAALGEYAEGAFLLFLFSLAHALEHYALGRARASIRALGQLAPAVALVRRGDRTVSVPVAEVQVGDRVLVKPAERIPVDGRIAEGRSAVNQAPITGESVPVDKVEGDEVFAGTINGEGALTVETTKGSGDRTLDRVIAMVEEAQTQKAPTQVLTDRFERVFVPCVLVAAAALAVLPPLLGVWDWSTSFYRSMALLVASSPCALALGTPAAVLAGIAQAARRGVLIKGGMHLEALGGVRALALDKTGTLTAGRPEVTDLRPAEGVDDRELLLMAAAVERQSQHPLAAAVVRRAEADALVPVSATGVESITGRGIRADVAGVRVTVGNARLFEEGGIAIAPGVRNAMDALQQGGRSVMLVHAGERWLGTVGLADQPRPGVREVLSHLRKVGIERIVMLTGDHQAVGDAVGREVGVDEVRGNLLPEDKVTAIKELTRSHERVAMVGDGVNDAPALALATVGIAMGGAGTATALETADVALMADDLGRLPFAIGLSRQARAVIRQNLYLSLAVIALLIGVTVTGVAGIGPAVLVHEGSTLVVIANALRLMLYERG